jgi:NAD(P)-dependent dehydrogenase (short-subunit alcohol dehydrogenase family)
MARVPLAIFNAVQPQKCSQPEGLRRKTAIHCVMLLGNNPLLPSSHALCLAIFRLSAIVNETSTDPRLAAYAASKAGLLGLTQALAAEFGAQGVRVNALLPGGTDTPMGRAFACTPEALAFVQGLYAMKRLALPDEIAQSALYLASDASSFTTGSALLVDGGISINRT